MSDEPPPAADLTPKQKTFCQEYILDLNGTQAAMRAGYSPHTANEQASRLLANVNIRNFVNELMAARSEKTLVTADYVLTTIRETVDRCKQSYPVLNRKGEQVFCETPDGTLLPAYTFDAMGALKGCDLLGKHLKLFSDKLDITITDSTVDETIKALEKRLEELQRGG